ncbi:MAG: DMT family transporter [Pseudomonadota bacterium]
MVTSSDPTAKRALYDERSAYLTGLLAVVLWSTSSTAFKLGLADLGPLPLVTLASILSTLILALLWALQRQRSARPGEHPGVEDPRAARRSLLREALLLGAINPLCYYPLLLAGYERLPAQIAQPLNYTWAIALALLAVPLLRQKLRGRTLAGIALSYGSAVGLLLGAAASPLGRPDTLGVLYILLSTGLWALYWILGQRARSEPLALLASSFAVGALALAVTLTVVGTWPVLSLGNLAAAAWIGAFEMGLTFVLWQRALARTASVGRVSQLIFLAPFLSLLPIALILGEPLQASSLLGLCGIVAGLLLTGRPRTPT